MAKDGSPARKTLDALMRLGRTKVKTPEYYDAYIKEISSDGGDRGTGILMVTTVEDALQDAIESRLSITSEDSETFFGMDSPMGTFANKIRMGRALDIYDNNTKQNLILLKAIRNAFAHSKISIDFKTKEIAEACNLLEMPRMPVASDGTQPRWSIQIHGYKGRPRFQMVCSGHAVAFTTYAFLAKNQRLPLDQPDNRYETLVRPKPLR
jgi:hypothetical protein